MTDKTDKKPYKAVGVEIKRLPLGVKILIGVAVFYLLLVGLGATLIVADPVQHVDAVVVLSGDDGDRLGLALEMLERGYTTRLILTDTTNAANARLKEEAIDGGFNENRIYLTDIRVDSTLDEAIAVLELAQAHHYTELMVVTDPYHSFRTRLIFRDVFANSGIAILVRPVVGHWYRSMTWFFHWEGWRFTFLEITKLLLYLLGFS
jgi:uncharacterized SAM-binding protein YcdF (DUF218 family)